MCNDNMKQEKKYALFLENAYCVFWIITITRTFFSRTVIDITNIRQPLIWLSFIVGVFVCIKICYEWKNLWDANTILFGLFGAGVILFCDLFLHHDIIGEYALLILGVGKIDKKKLLRIFLCVTISLSIITIFMCLTGKIDNVITYRYEESTHGRMALGFSYATNLSAQLLGIVAVWAYLRNETMTWYEIGIALIATAVCFILTEARISCFCIACIIVFVAIYKINSRRIVAIMKNDLIKKVMISSSLLLALASIILGCIYEFDSETWAKLDSASSHRLYMNATAFDRYDMTLWGQKISNIGEIYGGQHAISTNYFVLNTAYIDVLFQMGVFGFAATLLVLILVCYKEYKKQKYINVWILVVLNVFFFFEHRIFEIVMNPFLVLYMVDGFKCMNENYVYNRITKLRIINNKVILALYNKRRQLLTIFVAALLVETVLFNYKAILSLTNDEVSYEECVQDTKNVVRSNYGTLKSDEEIANLMAYDIPTYTGMESVLLDINYFDEAVPYHRIYEPYRVDIYDANYSMTEPKSIVIINPRIPASCYILLESGGLKQNLRFDIHFGKARHFSINKFVFNSCIPFDIKPLRILCIFASGLMIYMMWLIKCARKTKYKDEV